MTQVIGTPWEQLDLIQGTIGVGTLGNDAKTVNRLMGLIAKHGAVIVFGRPESGRVIRLNKIEVLGHLAKFRDEKVGPGSGIGFAILRTLWRMHKHYSGPVSFTMAQHANVVRISREVAE